MSNLRYMAGGDAAGDPSGSIGRHAARTPHAASPRASDDDLDLLMAPVSDEFIVDSDAVEQEPEIDLRAVPDDSDDGELIHSMSGRLAVVTGANDGIGRAVALALVAAGARVCVLGRDADLLAAIVTDAGPDSPVVTLRCDLGSAAEVRSAADFVTRFDRPVDVLVHCANVRVDGAIGTGDVADLDEQYLVNLRGPFLLTQALLGGIERGPGHVVFINPADDATFTSDDTQYAMTRSGVMALAQGLRDETAPLGVRVTTVHVGGRLDDGRNDSLSPDDVADCVLGAVEMPRRIEITDLHVRARVAPGVDA